MLDSALFKALGSLLAIWEHKDKTKELDRKLQLEKDFYEEWNRPEDERDDAVLDSIRLELCLLVDRIAAEIGTKNAVSGG